MTSEKKLTLKRLCIFILLAFVPTYLVAIFAVDINNLKTLDSYGLMLPPTVAHLLTRLITDEGFKDYHLRVNFKGNRRYYAAALVYPILSAVLGSALVILVYIPDYRLSDMINSDTAVTVFSYFFICFAYAFAVIIFAFGEEFGWRAYLTPKLEKLMPTSAALIVSGTIWGVWHAPLVLRGFNFGTEHPKLGVVMMCVSCIFYGTFLTWLTKRTNSVYPAAICHSLIDSLPIYSMLIPTQKLPDGVDFETSVLVIVIPAVVLGIYAWVSIIRGEKSPENPSNAAASEV